MLGLWVLSLRDMVAAFPSMYSPRSIYMEFFSYDKAHVFILVYSFLCLCSWLFSYCLSLIGENDVLFGFARIGQEYDFCLLFNK